ncbi:MAG: hypothetical protein ACI8ZV_001676 [Chitinophagales bacterium]
MFQSKTHILERMNAATGMCIKDHIDIVSYQITHGITYLNTDKRTELELYLAAY